MQLQLYSYQYSSEGDLLHCKDVLLTPAQLVAQQDLLRLFLQICFLSSQPQPVLFSGNITAWWKGSSVAFVELHEVYAGSFLQPVEVLLNSSMPSSVLSTLPFDNICEPAESARHPMGQVVTKDIKLYWPYQRSLRDNTWTLSCRSQPFDPDSAANFPPTL